MKLYFKKRDDGELAYYSDKTFDGAITITVSDTDFEKIQQNYRLKFTDKLEFETPPHILEVEKQQAKEKLKQDIASATTVNQLKDLLINII